jgi:hypothetical protein
MTFAEKLKKSKNNSVSRRPSLRRCWKSPRARSGSGCKAMSQKLISGSSEIKCRTLTEHKPQTLQNKGFLGAGEGNRTHNREFTASRHVAKTRDLGRFNPPRHLANPEKCRTFAEHF